MHRFRHHAQELDALPGGDGDQIGHHVVGVAEEDVALLVLGGRHVLDRTAGEELPDHHRHRELAQERVLAGRIDLEGMAEADQLLLHSGEAGEGLVDQLRGDHGVRRLVRVGRGDVVVLAGVDDDLREGADAAREVLVAERALHVDVAEEDPVHGVVEQHVEPLVRRHERDLLHAEPGAVVGEVDVATELL